MVTSPSREDTRVVTESSGRGFREGLINLTTANPATLNFLVTIFTAAHCGTQAGRGPEDLPGAAFSRPAWENFTFRGSFSQVVDYLIHASGARDHVRDLLLQLGRASSACSISRTSARNKLT